MRANLFRVCATVPLMISVGTMMAAQSPSPNQASLSQIAERAYIYAYPLVLLNATESVMPVNHLTHVPAFPDANFRLIVRPNADTLYSTAWLDVSKEPVLLHVPDAGGRFYLLQFMDAWTETFADPGKRTTGTSEAWFAIVGPGWSGKLPEHVIRLDAPTNQVWLLGRTQTNGASDYDNVHAFQHGMRLVPLSQFPGKEQPPGPPANLNRISGATPPDRVKAMEPADFFAAFARAMQANPPHAADQPMVAELARLGLVPGQPFDPAKLTAEQLKALNEGAGAAAEHIENFVASGGALARLDVVPGHAWPLWDQLRGSRGDRPRGDWRKSSRRRRVHEQFRGRQWTRSQWLESLPDAF